MDNLILYRKVFESVFSGSDFKKVGGSYVNHSTHDKWVGFLAAMGWTAPKLMDHQKLQLKIRYILPSTDPMHPSNCEVAEVHAKAVEERDMASRSIRFLRSKLKVNGDEEGYKELLNIKKAFDIVQVEEDESCLLN